ncbi:MAG TPA: putative toxin-antitoxin system toxin component, PIN family [Terracidiphilus sp.]|jgi:putative PIN family toxin of toxin-antitoxin system|nr:putative toxin-antitoxin system toxin component, PIN family [Terracidiphilus sp.]
MNLRLVLDTNVYVSYFIRSGSVPGQAVAKALQTGTLLVSIETFAELRAVLARPKFSRYIRPELLEAFLDQLWASAEPVQILSPIRACRDPRDDKFLEAAVHGRADLLITGDQDLLTLNPFRGIAILTPGEFLLR